MTLLGKLLTATSVVGLGYALLRGGEPSESLPASVRETLRVGEPSGYQQTRSETVAVEGRRYRMAQLEADSLPIYLFVRGKSSDDWALLELAGSESGTGARLVDSGPGDGVETLLVDWSVS